MICGRMTTSPFLMGFQGTHGPGLPTTGATSISGASIRPLKIMYCDGPSLRGSKVRILLPERTRYLPSGVTPRTTQVSGCRTASRARLLVGASTHMRRSPSRGERREGPDCMAEKRMRRQEERVRARGMGVANRDQRAALCWKYQSTVLERQRRNIIFL